MNRWQQQGSLWTLTPPTAAASAIGVVEFIGGTVLAATPQLSYRRLLEALALRGLLVRAWSYVPGFDHQAQATEAWRCFRAARESAVDQASLAGQAGSRPVLRLGHSLGCKLHLLAPDGGRGCSGLAAMSFNNFSADRSIPLLADLAPRLGLRTEFSPSPEETLRLVGLHYRQPRNLLIRFGTDALDQSRRLIGVLQQRPEDASLLLERPGDHLTPASAGLRQNLLGAWADDPARQRQIDRLADQLLDWWLGSPSQAVRS
ncbi:DUF1350 family protein [Synechococcus sp. CS-1324]|uniref:DUF1350 family protein n=1 Tax=unclassified Synechococcus TaxID=2626047 RepID=UPI000DB0A2E1|nr:MULTISPECIES: DUF1350 family protein [unclassified Synechococcus]MCT0213981.1 DUF1350 family protein [Synechococcus sp. CS-1326]MCT0230047.1 DUF1350 family protein [Synechococcus sp. CS-1324]MCT0233557.1 DUF1350 family protein [Synechococcus sp. CS-1327]PZV03782.1 MAG: alpha/beta hydrolase [Cyanobium sp.]